MSLIRPSRCFPAAIDPLQVGQEGVGVQVLGLLLEHLGVADDRVERRPQFVGHVRQELRLVPARLGKLPVRVLKLLEQPRILDGDDGLVRERLHEADFALGERTNFGPLRDQRPDGRVFHDQGHREEAPC